MKKRMLAFVGVLLVFFLLLSGCSAGSGPPLQAPLRVTAVLPHRDYGYWTKIANALLVVQAAHNVDVKISLPQLNYNIPQMVELIYAAVAAQVDALVVQGIENQVYIQAIEDARKAGVQIVFIDTDLPQFPEHLYVGTDNYAAGQLMAKNMVRLTEGTARVAVISGAEGYPNLDLRLQGIKDYIQNYPNIELVAVEYNDYDSITMMEKFNQLCASPLLVDTVLCIEGTGAMTLGNMLTRRPAQLRCVLGFDFSEESILALKNGVVDGLMIQDIDEMGNVAMRETALFAREGHYTQNTIYTPVHFINVGNLPQEGSHETSLYFKG